MAASVAVTIGNFDGVHRGHVALLAAAREEVGPEGRVVVLSFEPHPAAILRPGVTWQRLSRFDQRSRWLADAGADDVQRMAPSPDLLNQEPQEFLSHLVERFKPAVIVEGLDFRFGRGRSGSIQTLRDMEEPYGYRTRVVEPVDVALLSRQLVAASSTMIRTLVGTGRMGDAAAVLGRPYEVTGTVRKGDQRGRRLGVPTANVDAEDYVLPADGVYFGLAQPEGGAIYPAAISVGTKPSFGRKPRVLEAHLLGYSGDLDDYGWEVRLQILGWLREQFRYSSIEPLVEQIRRDLSRTAELLAL